MLRLVLERGSLCANVKTLTNGSITLILLHHQLIKSLRLRLVLCRLTGQLLLHCLRLRLVVQLGALQRLTGLLCLTRQIGLLGRQFLLEVLPTGSVSQFSLSNRLVEHLLRGFVLQAGLVKRCLIVLRESLVGKLLRLLSHAKLREQASAVKFTCAKRLLVVLTNGCVLRLLGG